MPGLARSGPRDMEIFSRHIAKARHQAGNYSYSYSIHLRRLSDPLPPPTGYSAAGARDRAGSPVVTLKGKEGGERRKKVGDAHLLWRQITE
jgi:hypothetical protein